MIQESDEFVLSWAGSGSEEMTPSWFTSASCLAISSGVLGCAVDWAEGCAVGWAVGCAVGAGVGVACSPSPEPS